MLHGSGLLSRRVVGVYRALVSVERGRMSKSRDVVVVQVSEKGDREEERFHSAEVQVEGRQAVGEGPW
jgi:hypothetical protein